jgi:hypothetical protein
MRSVLFHRLAIADAYALHMQHYDAGHYDRIKDQLIEEMAELTVRCNTSGVASGIVGQPPPRLLLSEAVDRFVDRRLPASLLADPLVWL